MYSGNLQTPQMTPMARPAAAPANMQPRQTGMAPPARVQMGRPQMYASALRGGMMR